VRGRDIAGRADRPALCGTWHQVLHRRHVPRSQYKNVAFIARHGSWNREKKFGYDVAIARISGGKAKIEPFLTGLLNEEKNEFYGRPVLRLPDEGWLDARFRREQRRRLSHQLRRCEDGLEVIAGVTDALTKRWRPLAFGLAAVFS
jgi:hypothetical protein